jgi:uncharacterized protein YjbI with pentapeptide repeats
MSATKTIGLKIAEARKKINISQSELAQRLFISSQAVGKWERGESMPDITTFNRLAEILGVDLNYFSETFSSAAPEITPADPLAKQSVESGNNNLSALHTYRAGGTAGKKPRWDMSRGNWADADFSGLKNLHEKFSSSNMQRCLFIGSDLSGLLLKSNNVDSCNFANSNLSNSHIQNSNLLNNTFKDCSLQEAEFLSTNVSGCNFSGANFNGTEFLKSALYGCDLTGVDFTGVVFKSGGFRGVAAKSGDLAKNTIANAIWKRTSFVDTHLADIGFTGTWEDCYFENCAFTRVTFQQATLINTFFKNKSLKKIQFIDCQADRMTYEFLKNGKADLTGVTLIGA